MDALQAYSGEEFERFLASQAGLRSGGAESSKDPDREGGGDLKTVVFAQEERIRVLEEENGRMKQ